LIARFVASRQDPDLKIRVMVALNRGARRSGVSVSELLQADWATLIDPLGAQAKEIALSDASPDRRLPAIALLGMTGARGALEVLPELLDARQPVPVQLAGLQALGQVNDPAVGRLVVSHWKSMSPAVRREASELLFSRRDRREHLLGVLESRTLAAAEIDPDRLKQLRTQKDPQLRARALRIIDEASLTAPDRKATLAGFQVAITLRGWPDQGHAVFLKTCATCHRVLGEGVEVGPDLATVAGRSPEDLLLHILDPNREVAPNYVNYNVATADGRTISGIIASESAAALTLKRAEAVTEVVPGAQIEAIASTS
jgi:putative heme-binding domain-containing protein